MLRLPNFRCSICSNPLDETHEGDHGGLNARVAPEDALGVVGPTLELGDGELEVTGGGSGRARPVAVAAVLLGLAPLAPRRAAGVLRVGVHHRVRHRLQHPAAELAQVGALVEHRHRLSPMLDGEL